MRRPRKWFMNRTINIMHHLLHNIQYCFMSASFCILNSIVYKTIFASGLYLIQLQWLVCPNFCHYLYGIVHFFLIRIEKDEALKRFEIDCFFHFWLFIVPFIFLHWYFAISHSWLKRPILPDNFGDILVTKGIFWKYFKENCCSNPKAKLLFRYHVNL